MKLQFKNREDGSMLFVAMVISIVVTTMLAGYLLVTSNRFQMTVRSQDWNAAIPVLEAGIEEALTHLHHDTNAPAANGWTLGTFNGTPAYTKQRTFTDGSYFYVAIANATSNNPIIYSQGFVRSPYRKTRYIFRTIKAGATNPPTMYTHAITAGGLVTLVGNSVVDAWDPSKGGYNATNRLAVGGIATDGSVQVGSCNVYGPVSVGASGTVSVGNSGSVGPVGWNSGISPGWTNNTMNVAFPTNSPPTGGPYLPPTSLTNMPSGTYQMLGYDSGLQGNITVSGNVTLYVTGNFNISSGGSVQILPGGNLTVILAGNSTMGGNGVINGTGSAANFSLIGLTSCTSISYGGNSSFTGTINAPQAAFSLSGTADAYGAIIANTVSMNGNPGIHYDPSLAKSSTYLVNNWQEL
jgi:hypothetical protein